MAPIAGAANCVRAILGGDDRENLQDTWLALAQISQSKLAGGRSLNNDPWVNKQLRRKGRSLRSFVQGRAFAGCECTEHIGIEAVAEKFVTLEDDQPSAVDRHCGSGDYLGAGLVPPSIRCALIAPMPSPRV
jgi:hypothetical protein